MKHKLSILSFALLLGVLGLAGCAKDGENTNTPPKNKMVNVIVTANNNLTRTVYQGEDGIHATNWCDDDKLGIFAYSKNESEWVFGNNVCFDIKSCDGTYAEFKGQLDCGEFIATDEDHDIVYHAYYPYQPCTFAEKGVLFVNLPEEQHPTSESYDSKADFLIGTTVETYAMLGQMKSGENAAPLNFAFTRPVAFVKFNFTEIPDKVKDEPIQKVVFKVEGAELAGAMILDLTAGSLDIVESSETVTLVYDNETLLTEAFNAWFVTLPVITQNFSIHIETENYYIDKSITAGSDVTFSANKVNHAAVSLTDPTIITPKGGPTVGPCYVRITSPSKVEPGEKHFIIGFVSPRHIRSMDNSVASINEAYNFITHYNVFDDTFVSSAESDAYAYTIEQAGMGTYTFKSSEKGHYIGCKGTNTNFSGTENKEWEILPVADTDDLLISNVGYSLRSIIYRYSSTLDRFAVYESKNVNETEYYYPRIYKYSDGIERLRKPFLQSTEPTVDAFTVSWEAVTDAVNYKVSVNGGEWQTQDATSYEASGLESNTEYTLAVIAVGDGNPYGNSKEASITIRTQRDSEAVFADYYQITDFKAIAGENTTTYGNNRKGTIIYNGITLDWTVTMGNNAVLGSNSSNVSKMLLGENLNVGTPYSLTAKSKAAALISHESLPDIGRITVTGNPDTGLTIGVVYSVDDGVSWLKYEGIDSELKTAAPSVEFTNIAPEPSARYAIVIVKTTGSGNSRYQKFGVKFETIE